MRAGGLVHCINSAVYSIDSVNTGLAHQKAPQRSVAKRDPQGNSGSIAKGRNAYRLLLSPHTYIHVGNAAEEFPEG